MELNENFQKFINNPKKYIDDPKFIKILILGLIKDTVRLTKNITYDNKHKIDCAFIDIISHPTNDNWTCSTSYITPHQELDYSPLQVYSIKYVLTLYYTYNITKNSLKHFIQWFTNINIDQNDVFSYPIEYYKLEDGSLYQIILSEK